MPTPKAGYWNTDVSPPKRLVSVTTAMWSLHPDGIEGLMGWQRKILLGLLHGGPKQIKLGVAAQEPDDVKNLAGKIGTLAHLAIEKHVNGEATSGLFVAEPPEISHPAHNAFTAFLKWQKSSNFQITHTELALVSKKHNYGGTLDAPGIFNGKRALADWKTSNRYDIKMLMQVAAYKELWNENYPDDPIGEGGIHVLRFNKAQTAFTHAFYDNLDKAFKHFLSLLELYDGFKELKKLLP
jgi:hypothetical protein